MPELSASVSLQLRWGSCFTFPSSFGRGCLREDCFSPPCVSPATIGLELHIILLASRRGCRLSHPSFPFTVTPDFSKFFESPLLIQSVCLCIFPVNMPEQTFKFFYFIFTYIVPNLKGRKMRPELTFSAFMNPKPATNTGCLGSGGHANVHNIILIQSWPVFEENVYATSPRRNNLYVLLLTKFCTPFY